MATNIAAEIIEIDRVGAVAVCVAETSEPWALELDAIVVSVGADGLGTLGGAVQAAIPRVAFPSLAELARITPKDPRVIAVDLDVPSQSSSSSADTEALRFVVLATVREDPNDLSSPVNSSTVAAASIAAVAQAAASGARDVGLPLLGTGIVGLRPEEVIPEVFSALRRLLTASGISLPDRVVLFSPDGAVVKAMRDGWAAVSARGVQLTMLADLPIDDPDLDILGTNVYAEALAFLIDHERTTTPLTIAINAPWGAGKTSVARLAERRLQTFLLRRREPIVCWFNAWHHDDAPHIATALASVVARTAGAERALWRRAFDPLPSGMLTPHQRRQRWFWTTVTMALVALVVLISTGAFHALTTGKITLTVLVTLGSAAIREFTTVRGTASQLGSLVRAPDGALASGSLDEVRADLGRLIHQATQRGTLGSQHRRLVVFIDDLERCQPERAIEVCETVSNLLSHEDVVVVLIGDMQTVATAAEAKYKLLAPRYRTGTLAGATGEGFTASFGELYLEKIVQFRFDLPTHNLPALIDLAHTLETRLEDTVDVVGRPPQRSRPRRGMVHRYRDWRYERRLRRHGDGPALSLQAQESDETSGKYGAQLDELQSLLGRLEGPSLQRSFDAIAALIRPLPRDLKRLLNRIRFYLYLLERRGLLSPISGVTPEVVGKWALLAERWPDLAIAVSGDPALLGSLEAAGKTVEGFVAAMTAEVPGYSRSAELQRLIVTAPMLGPHARCLSRLTQDT